MATEREHYSSRRDRQRFIVHGRVQGVGYRYFVRIGALSRGIRGWARNLPDGTVEVIAEGNPADLSSFESHLAIGPSGSEVTKVESLPVPTDIPEELSERFQVK